MLIRIGYDIGLLCLEDTVVHTLLRVHSSRLSDLCLGDPIRTEPYVPQSSHEDEFGNRVVRFVLPRGRARLWSESIIEDDGRPDEVPSGTSGLSVADVAEEALPFLRSSRYCNTEELAHFACRQFADVDRGWPRVQAVCDWVHKNIRFDYARASPRKTAQDVFTHRAGVCRDFAHLAITFCRALNIPARYVAGYLPDIGVPEDPAPMDFCAWFEVNLGGRWYARDARHNVPRIGRTLIARGRDAADAAMLTTFGRNRLQHFSVTARQSNEAYVELRHDVRRA